MSDGSVTVVGLEIDDAGRRADEVRRWLIESGVAAPNGRRDAIRRPSELVPGPAWRGAVDPAAESFLALANNGIDVDAGLAVHDPGSNFEPPACPSCRTTMAVDAYVSYIQPWLDHGEPTVACAGCGTARVLGNWDAPWGYAVGAPAVTFNNWPPLAVPFLAELGRRVGRRTFVVRRHL